MNVRRLGLALFAALMCCVATPVWANDQTEIEKLREDNARLREIASSALTHLQARTAELAQAREHIALQKKHIELQEQKAEHLLANLRTLQIDLEAHALFADMLQRVTNQDMAAYNRFNHVSSKDPKAYPGIRWRLKVSLQERIKHFSALEKTIFRDEEPIVLRYPGPGKQTECPPVPKTKTRP